MADRVQTEEICQNCMFFEAGAFTDAPVATTEYGACHRNPPQPAMIASMPTNVTPEEQYRSRWPSVRPTDWCGEFFRRNPSETQPLT